MIDSEGPDARAYRLASRQHGVLSLNQAAQLGLTRDDVKTRVRRGQFKRIWRGVLWAAAEFADEPPWITRAQGALLLHGLDAVLGLGSAATALGISGADGSDDVIHVVLPRGSERHQVEGIRIHTWNVASTQRMLVGTLATTTAMRTAADLVPRLRRNQAVAFLDSGLNRGLLTPAALEDAQRLAAGRPGAEICRGWWKLADGRAQSALETWTRLDCIDGDVAPDQLQYPVTTDEGHVLGFGDLAWLSRTRPLIGEADGAGVHAAPSALYRDRYRSNAFVSAGADIIRFTWADARRSGRCAGMARHALAQR